MYLPPQPSRVHTTYAALNACTMHNTYTRRTLTTRRETVLRIEDKSHEPLMRGKPTNTKVDVDITPLKKKRYQ